MTQFEDALNNDDVAKAASLTTDPAKASDTITKLYDGLGKDVTFDLENTGGDALGFAVDWNFGNDRHWRYTTTAQARETDQGWKLDWNPAMLAPGLDDTHKLQYLTDYPTPARVVDSRGGDLLTQQVVTLVNADQTADPNALATLLAPIAPTITAASLQSEIAAAQGKTITAITLRQQDLTPIEADLRKLAGVTLAPQTRVLTADRNLASPVFGDLTDMWQHNADAAAGWAVQSVATDGSVDKLTGADPKPTSDIQTTIDLDFQRAAEAALATLPQQSAIVAIRPSTGGLVAIAQNAAADAQGPIALTGLYPPGSTFKTVTVSAALQAGEVTPDTVLPCPGTENIEGRQIPNDDNFDLGQVPLHTAFARSCNTTMGRLAVALPPIGLQEAAQQLGLGLDFLTPGVTTVTGSVPIADTPAARVESGIGQGRVTASPFGMALVAASLAKGSVPSPMIVQGRPGTADKTPPAALPAGIADQILAMMRETVTAGTATVLNDIPGLRGKTGTAEYGAGSEAAGAPAGANHAHGWFVGILGDLAFAVFVAGADSSGPAVEAAGRFLRPIAGQLPG